jgi:2-polyprenyl-3-methyl-5-hydroxy-6-metoxy-1,4-benzoquinol methylase
LLLGYDITTLGRQVAEMQEMLRISRLDPHRLWLYEGSDDRMDATSDVFGSARRAFHLARYEFAAQHVADQVVADIACGTGYGSELLHLQGKARRVMGMDLDAEAVGYARAKHMPAAVEFLHGSGDHTGLPAHNVDVVVSFETIEHVPDDAALLAEFHRILRPAGLLICSTPNQWPIAMCPGHVRTYDLDTFRQVLSRQFEVVEFYNQNSGTDSPYNHGQPAGIVRTTPANAATAECLIAVCRARVS